MARRFVWRRKSDGAYLAKNGQDAAWDRPGPQPRGGRAEWSPDISEAKVYRSLSGAVSALPTGADRNDYDRIAVAIVPLNERL